MGGSGIFSGFEGWSGWLGAGRNHTRLGTSSIKSVKWLRSNYQINMLP